MKRMDVRIGQEQSLALSCSVVLSLQWNLLCVDEAVTGGLSECRSDLKGDHE